MGDDPEHSKAAYDAIEDPVKLRRVLEATERAVAEGRSVEEAVMEASHG